MVATRSSTRTSTAKSASSKAPNGKKDVAGSKRKVENGQSSNAKRQELSSSTAKPATVEDYASDDDRNDTLQHPVSTTEENNKDRGQSRTEKIKDNKMEIDSNDVEQADGQKVEKVDSPHGEFDDDEAPIDADTSEAKQESANGSSNGAVEISKQRERALPSSILEKGVIYFFTRGRVNMDEPEGVNDLQRSYFVLRPLPKGAKLGDGPIEDLQNNRLFALPKKVWPKSHRDRFMAFIEKTNVSVQDLKESFFQGSEYETKTSGTQHTPPVSPIGEGVYAITSTERSTHLVYMLTIPSELGEVQKEVGLNSRGSFVMSVKNPKRPGPASARLPEEPEFPPEIIEEFRGLAWVGVKPKYFDYKNVQVLLIGEGTDNDVGNALEPSDKDQKHNKEKPIEEMEKLEHEDELRVEHLHGDDSIFDDLELSKKEYPKVLTTW